MSTLLQDIRYGTRMVTKQPGFALIIVLTLALAIGANTVAFSFTNILVLRPLPVQDQDTLTWIFTMDPQRGGNRGLNSIPDFVDYRSALQSFSNIAASSPARYTLTGRGDAMPITASHVTANLIDTWGLRMALGRGFVAGEDAPGAPKVAVLSHRFWVRQFSSDSSIIGQALTLNGTPYTVVGVLRPEIEIGNLSLIDLWTPLTIDPSLPRDERVARVTARLKPGVSFEQAAAEVRAVSERIARDHPQTNSGWVARLAPTKEAITGTDTYRVLALLMLVVGFVLLIACANIANLVLARATGRRRELAVRAALGASRSRMVRQLLTESVLLGLLGGVLGLGVAYGGLVSIKAAAYEPFFELVVIDRNVLAFTALLSLLTPLVFSLVPALHASRPDVQETLKDNSARAGGGVRGRRSRAVLVVSQLALAMMLLIVSGLLVRTMIAINRTPLGFDPSNVLIVQVEVPEWKYASDASVTDYYGRLFTRLRALPGVAAVAAADRLPVLGAEGTVPVTVEGHQASRPEDRPWAVPAVVTEEFFAAAALPLLQGRAFTAQDTTQSLPVAVINREMARRYWGEPARALGGRVSLERGAARSLTVVGIAGDVKRADLRGVNPQIYVLARQHTTRAMSIMIRASDADRLAAAARGELRALDVDVAVQQIRTMDEAFDDELSSSRILTGMFLSFAVLALVLAASGLYGVISYSVSQRVQEIGIRMALGAVPGDIRNMVVRQTLVLVAVGAGLGLAGGAALARTTASLLYDVSTSDPVTYVGMSAALALVALFAAYAPVKRATRIDPLLALRAE